MAGGGGPGLLAGHGMRGGLGVVEEPAPRHLQRPTLSPSLSNRPSSFPQPLNQSSFVQPFTVDVAGRLIAPSPPARFQLSQHLHERSLGLSGRKGIHGRGSTGALAAMGQVRMRSGNVSNVKFGKKDKVSIVVGFDGCIGSYHSSWFTYLPRCL